MMYIDQDGQFAWLAAILIGGWVNVTMKAGKGQLQNFGDFLKTFTIGGAVSAAGYFAGHGISQAILSGIEAHSISIKLAGGFINGALVGAGAGAAGGFVSGAGNAWLNGSSFGRGLAAGFIGAGKGLVTGALTGGLIRGTMDALNGYNFWNGTYINEISATSTNSSNINYDYETADYVLKQRVLEHYNLKEGDWGITRMTTDPGKTYQLNAEGLYLTKKNTTIGGYVHQSSSGLSEVHISPLYATNSDVIHFKAIVGHEIIHAYHNYIYGSFLHRPYSERTGYQYTVNTYMQGGLQYYKEVLRFQKIALDNDYWYGYQYSSPF